MSVTCKLSVKVLKNQVKIRPIRSNPVKFFRLVIRFRFASGQNDPNPVWFSLGQNFRSGRTLVLYLHRKHIQFDMHDIVLYSISITSSILTCIGQNWTGNRLRSLSRHLYKSYSRYCAFHGEIILSLWLSFKRIQSDLYTYIYWF